MYALIQQHTRFESARQGRVLAARFNGLPGFVACLLLEELDGGWVTVGLFETRETLTDAQGLLTDWLASEPRPVEDGLPFATVGEVIVQRGL